MGEIDYANVRSDRTDHRVDDTYELVLMPKVGQERNGRITHDVEGTGTAHKAGPTRPDPANAIGALREPGD